MMASVAMKRIISRAIHYGDMFALNVDKDTGLMSAEMVTRQKNDNF
jgi:hypothetical protein